MVECFLSYNRRNIRYFSQVKYSTNGGAYWYEQSIPSGIYPDLYSVNFSDLNTGWAVGHFYYTNSGLILNTTNRGTNWINQCDRIGFKLFSVHFINNKTGWVVGSDGTILKTTNGGAEPVGIEPIATEIPNTFYLDQNYPNPFNPVPNIEFGILKSGIISLKVYDLLGKEAATLVDERLNAGKYIIEFNANGLTSGVYFYRFSADGFTDTKKMLILI